MRIGPGSRSAVTGLALGIVTGLITNVPLTPAAPTAVTAPAWERASRRLSGQTTAMDEPRVHYPDGRGQLQRVTKRAQAVARVGSCWSSGGSAGDASAQTPLSI
jgi:hypothetical protein